MVFRIESPSSINTYKQCPRKYYYQYILKLKTLPSIHTTRGNIVHSVLEDFFDTNVKTLTQETCESFLSMRIQDLLVHHWNEKGDELKSLNLEQSQMKFYFEESMMMLMNWLQKFLHKVKQAKGTTFEDRFKKLTPLREQEFISHERAVKGFIDAIEHWDDEVRLMDYKSSKKFDITNEYRLQLAIYAMLYEEKHGKRPHKVGICFLKDTGKHEYHIDVDEELIRLAKLEVELMHMNTQTKEIKNYPKNVSPLCKWSSGQCDFYTPCFEQKTLEGEDNFCAR